MFSKTLPASDFDLVTGAKQMVCQTPWHTMHAVGLNTFRFFMRPRYPKLDTTGIDVFIGQTPYPARISPGTAFVIRYHDALPIFMPHTIPDKARHQATHFYALMSNVRSGAYFACVSDATRGDLLKLFPKAADRAVTIPNMVSHHYYLDEASTQSQVAGIVRSRLYTADADGKTLDIAPSFLTLREKENFYGKHLNPKGFKYLLVVSTIEPRKNHSRLLAAWEAIKADADSSLKLVVVGTLGWNCGPLTKDFKSWIDRGELFMLNAVPAPDLRVLYRHAVATVCPSLGEGFDFSGVESMRSGGRVIASDIPVHREIYDNAAEYFNPYSTANLLDALKRVIYSPEAAQVQRQLEEAGQEVAARYQPDKVLPQWDRFLKRVLDERPGVVRRALQNLRWNSAHPPSP
jgi:glycosyltransferase involved in cell wall biosynthesis